MIFGTFSFHISLTRAVATICCRTWEDYLLESNCLRIDPEQTVGGVVNSDAVRPVDVASDDLRLLAAVHSNATNERVVVVPVRPEHVPAYHRYRQK